QIDTNGGTVDFKGLNRETVVEGKLKKTNGIVVNESGKLKLDVGTLQLTGANCAGKLTAATSLSTTGTSTDVRDSAGNLSSGLGSITSLTLQNDGTIEALGGILILNTGHTIENGLDGSTAIVEASASSTLEIRDKVNNEATGQIDTNGGTVDFKG